MATPSNVTDPLGALFHAAPGCRSGAFHMHRMRSFVGLVIFNETGTGDDGWTLQEHDLARCSLDLAGTGSGHRHRLVGAGREHVVAIPQDDWLPSPTRTAPIDVYQYDPRDDSRDLCHGADGQGETDEAAAFMELDAAAKTHGLMTATETTRVAPVLKIIMTPVLNTIMKPVLNAVVSRFAPDLLETLTEVMQHSIAEQVPGDAAEMIASSLVANLTNLLTDSLTGKISESLTDSLTADLGLYLKDTVSEVLHPNLAASLMTSLERSIPQQLNRLLPETLSRSLVPSLTGSMTRTLTHSLTHTLALALSHGKGEHQDAACRLCYDQGKHCSACHYSPLSMYYTNYYATYYADYYSEYYAKYYGDAVAAVDQAQHPLSLSYPKPKE